jgi:hypothetical protein
VLVVLQALQAQGAFFHDALVAKRNFAIELSGKPEFLGIVKIELSSLYGAIRAAETASGAALVHHGAQAIGRVIRSPRRAYTFARGIPAVRAHERSAAAHIDPVHKTPAGSVFVGNQWHIVFEVAS